jgi:RND family efflux transporter MFP subunit
MSSTLRDDLASLKIERRDSARAPRGGRARERRGFGWALLWLIPLTLISGAAAFAYIQYDRIRAKEEVKTALVQSMTTGEAEKVLSAKGYLVARSKATVTAKVPGAIEELFVEEGSKVKKGEVLAILKHEDVKAVLASKQAMVQRTEAELQEARADQRDKERKAGRENRLYAQSHTSTENVEKARAELEMVNARVSALEAGLAQMKASVRETEEMIRNMHIIAPFAGTVVSKDAEVGETIGMGMGGGGGSFVKSGIVTVADLDHLDVETDVAENLLSRVTIGQPAEVAVSAVPGRRYHGKLRKIIPMGDRSRGTVKVKVEILDPDQYLFPELVATVHFLPDRALGNPLASGVFVFVPKAAVIEQSGHFYVWVVDDHSRVRKRRVEVVVSNDELARVESGLKGGESVVLNPKPSLRDEELVKVAE